MRQMPVKHSEPCQRSDMAAEKKRSKKKITSAPNPRRVEEISRLIRRILTCANRRLGRIDFLRDVSKIVLDFSHCDAMDLYLRDPDLHYRWKATRRPERSFHFEALPDAKKKNRSIISAMPDSTMADSTGQEWLYREIARGRFDPSLPFFTKYGSFWIGDTRKALPIHVHGEKKLSLTGIRSRQRPEGLVLGGLYRSIAMIRLAVEGKTVGILHLQSFRRNHFTQEEIESYESVAQILGMALANRRVQWALRERVKELTCLYDIARVARKPGISLGETLQGIAELLPPAWQYPEIACARIILDGTAYTTRGFRENSECQKADLVVGGTRRGVVEVMYTRGKPEFAEGLFLMEEQSLIDTVAREVALIIEHREAEDYKSRLQDQIRHADRLATIGQLAAGMAHELNEPLGNILGFAQLAKKDPKLPKQAAGDVDKIVKSCLHAREVIHKLLIFARRMPPQKSWVNLNRIVEEGLYVLESRCAKAGIEMVRSLAPALPEINADPSQLHQVLVNLVVNAVQAMPDGGTLTIETLSRSDCVSLIVKDTGIGMTEDIKTKIFTPFFTTKDIDQGTGLGLAVVHGIVTSHGGYIRVDSEAGQGTSFEVQLPVNSSAGAKKSG